MIAGTLGVVALCIGLATVFTAAQNGSNVPLGPQIWAVVLAVAAVALWVWKPRGE